MKRQKLAAFGFLIGTLFVFSQLPVLVASAQSANNTAQSGGGASQQTAQPGGVNTPPAPATNIPLQIRLDNPLKVNTIQDAIKLFMDAVVKIAIPFIVVFFIWSGLQFILAQGNPDKLKKARSMFWYTVIGTLLILGAWVITDAIVGTINSLAS